MAIPATPSNVVAQNGQDVLLTWDIVSGATSYAIQRSTDNITFSAYDTSVVNNFLDDAATVNTQYWYKVASVNSDGTSDYSDAVWAIPTLNGDMALKQIREQSRQRADMVGSQFVTDSEWNLYINQSYKELYDLLVTVYEDYYVEQDTFTTDGSTQRYDLPTDFYKALGVDCSLGPNNNAKVTLQKFDFVERNRYVYPNITSTFMGVFNLRYRINGSKLMFIPTPSSGQTITLWYIPRVSTLLNDTDIADGVNGWTEYIIVDAAIKAMQKQESDVSVLMAQKQMLKQRIEESAINRDAGAPDTISPTRSWGSRNGGYWGPGDGSYGGF